MGPDLQRGENKFILRPLEAPENTPRVVIYMSIACQQRLSEQTPKKRPLHNSLSCRGFRGRGDRIRTYDLLTPSQTLCQAELRPVNFVAGSRESRCPMRPEDHTAAVNPGSKPRSGSIRYPADIQKDFWIPSSIHPLPACFRATRTPSSRCAEQSAPPTRTLYPPNAGLPGQRSSST